MSAFALVGAVGGVGTTRTTLELGAVIAQAGRTVAVLDAAFTTQGLSDHVAGSIAPDMMTVACGEGDLDDGLIEIATPAGTLFVCPAHGPFDLLARAKRPDSAQRFGSLIDRARSRFDTVLVDCPPVGANQAIAAVTAVDRVVILTPANRRGADGKLRIRERLADLGVSETQCVQTGTDPTAETGLVPPEKTDPAVTPTTIETTGRYASAVRAVARRVCGIERPSPD